MKTRGEGADMSEDLTGRTILVVEDEFFIGSDLQQIFADAGAESILVNTADTAVAKLAEMRFDAVILDIHLQDESTYPVADDLRRRSIPFVFLSGYLTIREGYTDIPFIDKPFTAETVTRTLKDLLRLPAH